MSLKIILVPLMLPIAGLLMSFAWIGQLKFKSLTFLTALAMSWALVLPEYILNVFSVRWGRGTFFGRPNGSHPSWLRRSLCGPDCQAVPGRNLELVSTGRLCPYGYRPVSDPDQV